MIGKNCMAQFKLPALIISLLMIVNGYSQDSLIFVIRVDDIYSRSTTYVPAEIGPFQSKVESKGGLVTWAVMPHRLIETMNTSGRLTKELKQTIAAGHEISQHGYTHICTKCNQSSHEMYCTTIPQRLTYEEQKQIIESGLRLLADSVNMAPVSFVPPGHKADTATYRVLYDKNFEFLSSTVPTKAYIREGVYNLAADNEYTWALTAGGFNTALSNALSSIRTKGNENGYYCLLLHDPFIRPAYENGLVINWIGALLDSLNLEYGSKIKYRTLSQAARSFRDPVVSSADEIKPLPQTYSLARNFPNPFNPATTIRFSLTKTEFVTLTVFNSLGQEISVLASGIYPEGNHDVAFDAAGLSGGLYFYRLSAGGNETLYKMMLLK